MISRILVSLGLVLSVHAADIDPLEGAFHSHLNEATVLTSYEIEGVWSSTSAGRARLEELRELGATCTHIARGEFRCQRFLRSHELPGSIRQRFAPQFSGASLFFEQAQEIELLYKGELAHEYLVTQRGVVTLANEHNDEFSAFRYFFANTGLEKIQAGTQNPTPYGFVRHQDRLELIVSTSLTLGRHHFQVWYVAIPFFGADE
jgi:hypothetical protein